jgi:hypothetical protein
MRTERRCMRRLMKRRRKMKDSDTISINSNFFDADDIKVEIC